MGSIPISIAVMKKWKMEMYLIPHLFSKDQESFRNT